MTRVQFMNSGSVCTPSGLPSATASPMLPSLPSFRARASGGESHPLAMETRHPGIQDMSSRITVGLSTNLLEPDYVRRGVDGIGVYTSVLLQGLSSCGCDVQGWSFPGLFGSKGLAVGRTMPAAHEFSAVRDLMMPRFRTRLAVDVFHTTDYRIIRMECPVVATLHDATPMIFPQWYGGRVRKLKNHLLRQMVRNADHFIALSHFSVAELVEHFGIDEKRITVVHCGVAAHWLDPLPPEETERVLARHGLRPGYFLFVGTLQPRKNIERILEAYLRLPADVRKERQLVIAGRAGWSCKDLLVQIKGAQQRGEQVIWLDYVAGEDNLRHLYAGAGVFVFPSLHEGFGIPVVEAFASGVPVVTSNTTSLPEVSQGAALEVDPVSVSAIGSAMLSLVRDEILRQRCIVAGRRRASELTWSRTVKKTAAVYGSVLGMAEP
jgi:glycosyltransferase involved in cell wall biosynthesis